MKFCCVRVFVTVLQLIPEFYIGNGSILQEHLFFPSFDDPSENSMDVKLPKWANSEFML